MNEPGCHKAVKYLSAVIMESRWPISMAVILSKLHILSSQSFSLQLLVVIAGCQLLLTSLN